MDPKQIIKPMKINLTTFKNTAVNWYNNDPFTQSAAISYYTIFSFPALAFMYLSLASIFAEREDVQNQLARYLRQIIGSEDTQSIQEIIEKTAPDYTNFWALSIGAIILIFAGLKLFLQLQLSLNNIWKVEAAKNVSILSIIKQRAVAFGVMLSVIFIMMTSLIISSVMAAISEFVTANIAEQLIAFIFVINLVISLSISSLLFALLLKLLPDVHVKWRFALCGGLFTAVLFAIGQYGLSIYFKLAAPASSYGVTASIILMMLWVSYTCMILLMGAEFIKVLHEQNMQKAAKATKLGRKKNGRK